MKVQLSAIETRQVSIVNTHKVYNNVHYQPLLSSFNEKAKIKKHGHNIFTNHFKFSSSEDSGHSGHPPSLINVLGGRIKKWMDAHRANIADDKNHNSYFYTFELHVFSWNFGHQQVMSQSYPLYIALDRFKLGS